MKNMWLREILELNDEKRAKGKVTTLINYDVEHEV